MPSFPSSLVFFVVFVYVVYKCYQILRAKLESSTPVKWPLLGMIPGMIYNLPRIHQFITEVLCSNGGTFFVKGPTFSGVDMIITADPANVHYILTKNFQNFPKGPEFKKIFDILGEGIFTADEESWEKQRRAAKSFINNTDFQQFSAITTWNKVETGLILILKSAYETGEVVDLQELFQRLAYDCTCLVVLGHDPGSLSKDLPHIPSEKAFADAEEALLYRHLVPEFIWRIQKLLQIGTEKKLSRAKETLHGFVWKCISEADEKKNGESYDILSCYNRAVAENPDAINIPKEIWKDASLSLLTAGKDTISAALTWFLWLLTQNPEQEEKIRREIAQNSVGGDVAWRFSSMEELKKLVYLHGALCETLRLYPPVGLQHKAPLTVDILPSGHRVKQNVKTVLSFYSMGRMESIWGKDCLEFKPERWISRDGVSKVQPSFKFPAFNAGPRSCIGKDISFVQMKIVAAAILCRFTIRVAEGHHVAPKASVVLHMKHGLKVRVEKLG